jgi:large conductance mechanosensitive channel
MSVKGEVNEFVHFINRGNVIDLAVGSTIAAAFGAVVTSFTKDILSPILDIFRSHSFENSYYVLRNGPNSPYDSQDDAKQDGAAVVTYGSFLQSCMNFLIQAICIFILIRGVAHLKQLPLKMP